MRKLMASWVGLALCLTTATASAARVSLDLREQKAAVQSAPRKLMKAAAAPKSDVLRQGRLAVGATKVAPLNVGDTLGLQLFEGAEIELTLKELTDGSMGGRSFLAEANGYAGVKNAVVVETADGLQMDIQDYKTGKVYTVYSGADGVVVKELAPVRGQTVPTAETPPPEMLLSADEVEAMGLSASDAPGDTRLDILVAFDANARSYAELQGGGMTNFAQVAVQKMNAALANTGLSDLFRFRLVGVTAVDASERDVHEALYAISAGEGGWAAIAEKREEVGADIVTMLIDTGSAYGTVGVGWSLSGGMDPASFSESAYNVCAIQSVAQSHTMAHECGHNLGAGHSERQMTEPGPQLYDYSAGYYFTVDGTSYHTIMAYDDDGVGNSYTPVPYFSSPDYTYLGVPVGDAKHDNTRTLRNTFAAAAAWRERVVPMTYDVTFSPAAGATFDGTLAVTLTAEKPDAVIRYTTDGSVPTIDSPVYTGPIVLTETTTIRAIAVEDGVGGVPFEAKYWSSSDLGVALGAPELEWRTSSEHPWQVQTGTTLDGLATAGTAGSWLSVTIEGPASISFFARAEIAGGPGSTASLTIDGTPAYEIKDAYNRIFYQRSYDIPEGLHEIRFSCEKGTWLVDEFEIRYSRSPTCSSMLCEGGKEAKVALSHVNPTATVLFTLDGSDPTGETAIRYAGPFFVSEAATVKAVAYEPGRGPSVETCLDIILKHQGLHVVRPGVWTPDANCALASAKRDGRLLVVYYGDRATCIYSNELESYSESPDFLAWAAVNGIYLVTCDFSRYADVGEAWALFSRLAGRAGVVPNSTPTLVVTAPDNPTKPLDGHTGSTFHSAAELASYFASFLGGGDLLDRPHLVSPVKEPAGYPFEVELENPNGRGDIYFTLDGSEPTRENGAKYEESITIAKAGTTLKAVVWEGPSGGVSGLPLVVTYGTAEGGGDAPEVSAPQGVIGEYVESNGPLLRWKSVEGALFYRIYAANEDDFSSATLLGESKLPQHWDFTAVAGSRYYWVTSVGEKESAPSPVVRIDGIKPCVEFDLGEQGVWNTGIPMKRRISVPFGQAAAAPAMHAGPGWRFVGWSEDVSCVRSNMSVVARYEPVKIVPFTSDVIADWYVDCANGDDGNSGRSYDRPFATLQRAVDAASDGETMFGETIVVNDGIYAPIDASMKPMETITIRSLHGWPSTVIDGGGMSRCATLGNYTSLSGFTLRNGRADSGGGVFNGTATHCLIVCNVAQDVGGGSCDCELEGCILAMNSALSCGGACSGTLDNCIVFGNSASDSAGGAGWSSLNGCTVVGNTARTEGAACLCNVYNSIVWGNVNSPETFRSECRYVCTDDVRLGGVRMSYANPRFEDAEQGDFRLRSDSPCIDAGLVNPSASIRTDLAGAVRVQGRQIDLGAYESKGALEYPLARPITTLFVDSNRGSDENSGFDEQHPFRTIQKAIESSVDGDVIVVGAGVYEPICTFGRRLDICSIEGAERTVIDGGGMSGCARLDNGNQYYDAGETTLTGFTLRNGFAEYGGGTLAGQLRACVLRENLAMIGGGSARALLGSCLVEKNVSIGTNRDTGCGGGAYLGNLYGCTFVDNAAWVLSCADAYGLSNCILWNNVNLLTGEIDNAVHSAYYTCSASLLDGEGNICADPLFVDAAHGDYRLSEGSPCIDAGDNSACFGNVDVSGRARISGGRVDLGAFERQVRRIQFYPNGGRGVMADVPFLEAAAVKLPHCSFERDGYSFVGWSMSPDGDVAYVDEASVDGGVVGPDAVLALYAQWDQIELFQVGYALGGGVNAPGNPTTFMADDLPIVLEEPTREGYRFLGWIPNDGVIPVGTAANVTFMALWEKIVEPPPTDPDILCNIKAEYRTKADLGVVPVKVVNVDEEVKIAVKGLPSGVKFTAKDIADRKSKKVTVPANSIYGAPTKSGVYAATVTVTPTDRKSKMAPIVKTLTFVVRNAGEHIVIADCDAAQGAVKGMGVYAKGKKVTLKATAAKGYVFSGWYDGDALVSRLASYVLTMPNKDVKVSARFVTVAADKKSIGATVDGFAFGSAAESGGSTVSRDVVVKQGIYVKWPVAASALSATTVKVSGLPSGLKFTAKDVKATKTSAAVPANTIYGTPKTASKTDKNGKVTPSKVKITVTTAGKQKQEYVINVTVRGIPAEGTFNGGSANGLVTLTVAKTGKISGKYLADGKTWTLSAAGFDTWDDHDRLTATLTAKSGKEVKTVALVYEDGRVCASLTSGQETASPLWEAWRNEWKTEPQKSLAATLKGLKVTVGEDDNIVLTVGSNGAVTAKGTFGTYSASCSTVLIPTESKGRYVVYLYFPPKAGKFGGWVGTAHVTTE